MLQLSNPPDELKIYELSLIWKEAAYNFAFWQKFNGKLDWDVEYKKALSAVLKTKNIYEYYLELKKFAALLRDGHTDVNFPPSVYESAEYTSKLPVWIAYSNGCFVISNVKRCAGNAVKRWSVVKKINGIKIHDYLKEFVFPYILHEKLDSVAYYIHEFISCGPLGSIVEFELDYDGEVYTAKLERTKGDVDWIFMGNLKEIENVDAVYKSDSHQIAMTRDQIAIITIDTMANDKLPEEFYANFPLLEKARGYIIDIRYNGGGNSGNSDAVAAAFMGKGFTNQRYKHPIHSGAYKAWAMSMGFDNKTWDEVKAERGDSTWIEMLYKISRQEYYEEETSVHEWSLCELPGILTAPLVILTTANTCSAAEDFLVAFEHAKRATFVGTPSYGSTGQPLFINLESGGSFRICTRHLTHIDGREFTNIGVKPHIHFEPTLQDLKSGKDVHMGKGLEVIRKMLNNGGEKMLEVNKDTFDSEVLQAEGKVLVDYYGDGCVPCEAIMPFVNSMAEKYVGKIKFVKLNTSKARRLAIGQKILGLPVIAVYKNGVKIEELVKDDATETNIEAMILRHV